MRLCWHPVCDISQVESPALFLAPAGAEQGERTDFEPPD